MKFNWNDILGHYKGSNYNMGDVVSFAQSTGCDLETTIKLVAEKFPNIKKLEMLDIPQPYLSIEPVGGQIDSAAYEQMNLAASLPVFVGGALIMACKQTRAMLACRLLGIVLRMVQGGFQAGRWQRQIMMRLQWRSTMRILV